jgi:hypothetical protein
MTDQPPLGGADIADFALDGQINRVAHARPADHHDGQTAQAKT